MEELDKSARSQSELRGWETRRLHKQTDDKKTNSVPDRSYLRPDEYAARVGVCRRVLNNWMQGNVIPFIKVGRVVLIDPKAADASLALLTRNPGLTVTR